MNDKIVIPSYKVKLNLATIDLHDLAEDYTEEGGYNPPTLVDFALLFYAACPDGVSWQLAWELSQKLGLDYDDVNIALDDILDEYRELDKDQEIERYDNVPLPGRKYHGHVDDRWNNLYSKNQS
jgi:hypothetical protein